MKSRISFRPMTGLVMMLCCQTTPVLLAQDAAPATANPGVAATASASELPPAQLSSGVPEILKLARARVNDEVIIAFIKNSGRIYSLSVSEIVYLREQGVSNQALTAMLNQQQNVAATAAQAAPQPIAPAPAQTQYAPVYVDPSPVSVYSTPSYSYYDYPYYNSWPYYGGYWGYPGWSFSLGFGGGYYGGYYGRGYHGGGYYGGGYHGGGYYGGGYHGGGYHGGGGGGGHR